MESSMNLDGMVCIYLDIRIWSAQRKLSLEDLKKVAPDQIPPESLARLGEKRIYDPARLKVFNTLKKRLLRAIESVGIHWLGGYAVPKDCADGIVRDANAIQAEWERLVSALVADYDLGLDHWCKENPEWSGIIRRAALSASEVRARFHFDFTLFNMKPAEHHEAMLEAHDSAMGDTLIRETAKMAEDAWTASFSGKEKVTRKALRPLVTIRDKLDGLSFLDPRAGQWIGHIDAVLTGVPRRGPIEGVELDKIAGLLLRMARGDMVGASQMSGLFPAAAPVSEADLDEPENETPVEPPQDEGQTPVESEKPKEPSVRAPAKAQHKAPAQTESPAWF